MVPMRLAFLFFGVIMGLALGAIPGLGGLVGLAVLLPFAFDMDPFMAFAIVIAFLIVGSLYYGFRTARRAKKGDAD